MYEVKYKKIGSDQIHVATFDNVDCANLFWESVMYLHNVYQMPLTVRPRAN